MKSTSPPWEIILILLVIIMSIVVINKAVQQHKERVAWENSINAKLAGVADKANKTEITVKEITKRITNLETDITSWKVYMDNRITQVMNVTASSYTPIAGCYGVVPENESIFTMQCDKEFVLG